MVIQKKFLYRIMTLLICLTLLLSVSSCGKKNTGNNDTKSNISGESGDVSGDEENTDSEQEGENTSQEGEVGETSGSNSKSNGNTGDNGGTASRLPQPGAKNPSTEIVNNCYTTGYPITKEKITFNIWLRDYSKNITKYNSTPIVKYIEDTMNITLKFTPVAEDQVMTRIALAYSTNDMPDMFWGMAPANDAHHNFIKQGKVVEVGQYLNKYAPNAKKIFSATPAADYLATFDDGKKYMLPKVDMSTNYSYKLFINKTWLSQIEKGMPTTTAELESVLELFNTKKPGGAATVPMMVPGDIPPSMFGPFGVSTYLNWLNINQSTNQVEFTPMTSEYREGLRYFKRLFEKKLLDQNFRGATLQSIRQKTSAANPTVGVFATTGSWEEGVSADNYLKHYTVVPPLKGPNAAKSTWSYVDWEKVWSEWAVITTACKYKEAAVRLIDFFYSPEGTLIALQGPPGANNAWNYDSKGKYVPNYSKIPSGKSFGEFCYEMSPGYAIPHYVSDEYLKLIDYKSSAPTNTEKADTEFKNAVNTMFKNIKPTYVLPKLSFTQTEVANLSSLGSYQKYAQDMRIDFINGTTSIDTGWDNYISTLQNKQYGINQMLTIYNQSYSRYLFGIKNKK